MPVNSSAQKTQKNSSINLSPKPVKEGLNTAGAWFGFGIGLDLVTRKCNFFKSPLKNSLAINGIIGATAGLVSGVYSCNKKTNHQTN